MILFNSCGAGACLFSSLIGVILLLIDLWGLGVPRGGDRCSEQCSEFPFSVFLRISAFTISKARFCVKISFYTRFKFCGVFLSFGNC